MYEPIVPFVVLFPPISPFNRRVVVEHAKEHPNDRILKVYYNDDHGRYGVKIKFPSGKIHLYTYDRSRIVDFDISEVPKSKHADLIHELLRFTPSNDLIAEAYTVKTPYFKDTAVVYYDQPSLNRTKLFDPDVRTYAIKRLYNWSSNSEAEQIIPEPTHPEHNTHPAFIEVESKVQKKPDEETRRIYIESYKLGRTTVILGSISVFLNWHWWNRPDLGDFFF